MDPDVAYSVLSEFFADDGELTMDEFENARDAWQALDEWLKRGGFSPREWDQARKGK
jgi:hypothetical protein